MSRRSTSWTRLGVFIANVAVVFQYRAFVIAPANAMGIRNARSVLAHGRDGSTLVEIRSSGPEGGGSLAYRFEGGRQSRGRAQSIEYVLSSDFSPGDGSRPQTVSPAECQQRVEAIRVQLDERGYVGASVDPARCLEKHRSGLVTVPVATTSAAP